jgi:hypothetical protein
MSGFPITAEQHAKACSLGYPKWHDRYAAPPGSGPEGATCGACAHARKLLKGTSKRRCNLVGTSESIPTYTPACVRYVAEGDRP